MKSVEITLPIFQLRHKGLGRRMLQTKLLKIVTQSGSSDF